MHDDDLSQVCPAPGEPPQDSGHQTADAPPTNAERRESDFQRQRDILFEISEDLLCVAGFDGYFKQVNPAWTRSLGWTKTELLSRPVIEFVHPDDREITLRGRNTIKQGETLSHFENRYLCKDGSFRWLSWSSHPSAEVAQVFCIARDITQSKVMEQQLMHMHRMESVGTLAGGIAHHLNNTLTPLTMTLDFLSVQNPDPYTQSLIHNSQAGLNKGIQLIQRLLEYAQPKAIQSDTFSIPALFQSVLDLLEKYIPPAVQVNQHLEADLPQIIGDFTQLQQVFMELIINAVDAMPSGGPITLSGRLGEFGKSELADNPEVEAGTYAILEVQDGGPGIATEDLPRIFEPFYSKKDIGKGTGLGLSTAYTVIRNHGGCIRVQNTPHSGCCIRVLLPLK